MTVERGRDWGGSGPVPDAAVVVASNILVQFLFGNWLTWGAISYPIAFLVTVVMNRVYGAGAARRVVLSGFVINGFNADNLVIGSVVSVLSFTLMIGISALELLVAGIQAYVFALLTSLYINDAVNLH